MPQYDLPEAQLRTHRAAAVPPEDLHEFWDRTLVQARRRAFAPKVEPVDAGLTLVEVFDVTFAGFDGDPIRAWYRRPAGVAEDLPLVVRYQGYTGGRGLPHQVGPWPLVGCAVLDVDTRGQGTGAGWVGDTPDPHGHGPSFLGGFMTRGLLDPEEHYYRRVFTDAVLAVDAALLLPGVDPARVAVTGISQGGGIALAVSALRDDLAAVMADVPFLSDIARGVTTAGTGPYLEVAAYLASHRDQVEAVLRTLSYVDTALLVTRSTAPALFSVALMDTVCPPSTVWAAHNAYGGPKQMITYPYNDHEGGQFHQEALQLRWLVQTLG